MMFLAESYAPTNDCIEDNYNGFNKEIFLEDEAVLCKRGESGRVSVKNDCFSFRDGSYLEDSLISLIERAEEIVLGCYHD